MSSTPKTGVRSSETKEGTATTVQRDFWRPPALLLWTLFFLIGLVPFQVYVYLRHVAEVVPQRALINSEFAVTLALAGYVTLFCYQRCREMALTPFEAQDKALQLGLIGLVAFLPFDYAVLLTAHLNPAIKSPALLYIVGAAKLFSWFYLYSLFLRYYAFGVDNVFIEIPSVFPSARRRPTAATSQKSPTKATPLTSTSPRSEAGENDSESRLGRSDGESR